MSQVVTGGSAIASLSAIGRPLDPKYPTNRAIAAIFGATAIGFFGISIVRGEKGLAAAEFAAAAALAVFLSWAICRELDPDKDLAAFVAATLSLPVLYFYGVPSLAPMFWLMLVMRVINRTTGAPATILDSAMVFGFGIWLCVQYGIGIGLLTSVALLVNGQIFPKSKFPLIFAGVGFASVLLMSLRKIASPVHLHGPSLTISLCLSSMLVPVIIQCHSITAVGDLDEKPLSPIRVRSAQLIAALTGMYLASTFGDAGLLLALPLWASSVGALLFWLYEFALRKKGPA